MFKFALFALVFSLSSLASAGTITYKVDYESMSDIDPETVAECGAPEILRFQNDADNDLAGQVLGQYHPLMSFQAFNLNPQTLTLEVEGRNPNYAGTYQQTIFTIRPDDMTTEGLMQVDAFGPSEAPTGLVIITELVNEATPGEEYPGPLCGELWYVKQ